MTSRPASQDGGRPSPPPSHAPSWRQPDARSAPHRSPCVARGFRKTGDEQRGRRRHTREPDFVRTHRVRTMRTAIIYVGSASAELAGRFASWTWFRMETSMQWPSPASARSYRSRTCRCRSIRHTMAVSCGMPGFGHPLRNATREVRFMCDHRVAHERADRRFEWFGRTGPASCR